MCIRDRDTSTRQRFWEIVNDLKKSGVTILYSSHYIEEVEHTADRILVLHQGKLIRDTTPYAMRHEEKEKQVTLPSSFVRDVYKRHSKGLRLHVQSSQNQKYS